MAPRNVYGVSQINQYIRNLFTKDFVLNRLYMKGEISNCKYHHSGHIYFSLKDKDGSMNCIMFSSDAKKLRFQLVEGQQIIVFGSIAVYEKEGKYQCYVKEVEAIGKGALYEAFEKLKEELAQMGMFDLGYKKPIPSLSKKVGIVTAPTGAAIRDIMNIAYRRNPYVELVLYPALVQGEGAIQSIVKGIQTLDKYDLDVIIIGRGGGSIEDLWAFNTEEVARAIFACETPIISAVGHETDTTISDYVADLRAPTPSAAAELAVANVYDFIQRIEEKKLKLFSLMGQHILAKRQKLKILELKLNQNHPEMKIRDLRQRLLYLEEVLEQKRRQVIKHARQSLEILKQGLQSKSPYQRLKAGYSYVTNSQGYGISTIFDLKEKEEIHLFMLEGKVSAEIKSIEIKDNHGR